MIVGAVRKECVERAWLCGLLGCTLGKEGELGLHCEWAGGENRVGGRLGGRDGKQWGGRESRCFERQTYRERHRWLRRAKAGNDVGTNHGQGGTHSGKLMISESLGRGAMSIGHSKPCGQ